MLMQKPTPLEGGFMCKCRIALVQRAGYEPRCAQINFFYIIIDNKAGIAPCFFLSYVFVYKTLCHSQGCTRFANYCQAHFSVQN